MSAQDFAVFLVDDDPAVLKALKRLVETRGYGAETFTSATEFLSRHDPSIAGCAIIDLAMPGLDGLSLQRAMSAQANSRPVIFVSGEANLASGIEAMRAGAVDFLEKPVDGRELLAAIERAAALDRTARQEANVRKEIRARVDRLTRREFEVLEYVVAGRLNKQIAFALGTVEKTIKVHRSRMMAKMGVHTVADLVRMTEKINLQPHC
ncbi:response regulator [Microbacteriaceae bacterium K1510]|nr:response regulator [Microbacteriaceae bacterium K1510]